MNYSICLTLCGLLLAPAAVAAPFVPRTDNEVLEHLPFRPTDPVAREISGLRRQLAAQPQDMATALQLARSYFAQAGAQSDPRYVGYAQAALKPWWNLPKPPAPVLVVARKDCVPLRGERPRRYSVRLLVPSASASAVASASFQ